jgi:hypothetical protein
MTNVIFEKVVSPSDRFRTVFLCADAHDVQEKPASPAPARLVKPAGSITIEGASPLPCSSAIITFLDNQSAICFSAFILCANKKYRKMEIHERGNAYDRAYG